MIVRIPDLTEAPRALDFRESAALLNGVLAEARHWCEQRFAEDVTVCGEVYRHGSDVYFEGSVAGTVICVCPRCLDEFPWALRRRFRFLIVKAAPGQVIEDDDGLDHYEGDDLDLGRLAREQALLALDDSALCSQECRGLCAGCGVNRNHEPCRCRGVGT